MEQAELGVGVRLLWALEGYLFYHGGLKEHQGWLQRLLALPAAAQPSIARAWLPTPNRIDFLSESETDQYAAELGEAIGLSRELGDRTCLAYALRNLAFLRLNQGRYDEVDPLAAEAFPLLLAAGRTALALITRGHRITAALARGDLATAEALLAANQTLAGTAGPAALADQAAELAEARGDLAETSRLLEEFVRRVEREFGAQNPVRLAGLVRLAWVALRQGDPRAAVTACAESLAVQRRVGPSRSLPAILSVLALTAERAGLHALSTRLAAAIAVGKRALDELKARAEKVVRVVFVEYRDLPEDWYLDRWSLVQLLADLTHPAALRPLDEILSSPIPPERSAIPHGFSSVGEEIMIRTTAVEAVVRLSATGLQEAQEVLLKHVRHPAFSVRRACVQGLAEMGGDQEQAQLQRLLGETGEERLLEIKRVDVRQVPQATGGLFLVHPDTRGAPPPHDLRGKTEI